MDDTKVIKHKGLKFLLCALAVVLVLILELLVLKIELSIYGTQNFNYRDLKQNIIHWSITIFLWIILGSLIITISHIVITDFNLLEKVKKMNLWQYICILAIIGLKFLFSYLDWKGFKFISEYNYLGTILFIFQYLYYIAEGFLLSLIVVYSQNAFDAWFKTKYIPWGGIVLSLSWGILHIVSKGLLTGIFSMITSLLLGSIYLLTNRDYFKSELFMTIVFII